MAPPSPRPPTLPVLVLGSRGVVGQALVRALAAAGYAVDEVRSRVERDLRRPEIVRDMVETRGPYAFGFFLASENGDVDSILSAHNTMIYEQLFPFFQRARLPFIFASSYRAGLSEDTTAWAQTKRDGEARSGRAGGKSVRLWHVYGPVWPSVAPRHVVPDWMQQCAQDGRIVSRSGDRHATRYFTHANDVAHALVLLMQHYATMPPVVDLSQSHVATSLTELATHMLCPVTFPGSNATSDYPAPPPPRPREASVRYLRDTLGWQPVVSLDQGLRDLAVYYATLAATHAQRCRDAPYVSVILNSRADGFGAGGPKKYPPIHERMANALRFLAYYAQRVSLAYEVVVGEYNRRATDGHLVTTVTWPRDVLVRIRTVPYEVHSVVYNDTSGNYWEYAGQNAAARVARGQWIFFTNPDDFQAPGILERFARQDLHPRVTYTAPRIMLNSGANFSGMSPEAILAHMNEKAPPRPINVRDGAQRPQGVFTGASGDFTLVHRDTVWRLGGYPDGLIETHADNVGLTRFATCLGPYPQRYQHVMEWGTFHQEHTRRPLPQQTGAFEKALTKAWPCSRAGPVSWGLGIHDSRMTETVVDTLDAG